MGLKINADKKFFSTTQTQFSLAKDHQRLKSIFRETKRKKRQKKWRKFRLYCNSNYVKRTQKLLIEIEGWIRFREVEIKRKNHSLSFFFIMTKK